MQAKNNPYGGQFAAFDALGVTVEFNETTQTWTINFGELTQDLIDNETFIVYVVVEDLAGNEFGTMYGTTPDNTFEYTLERDVDAPVLGNVTPNEGEIILSEDDTFIWTIQFDDPNLVAIEVDHNFEGILPEFWLHANEANPYGTEEDKLEFESYGVLVVFDADTQTWTINFGSNISQNYFLEQEGVTFYVKAFDVVGNEFGTMSGTTPENTFVYTMISALDFVVRETQINIENNIVTTTNPDVIPAWFDDATYTMNTVITVSNDIDGLITIVVNGHQNQTFTINGLPAGTYTYTELIQVAEKAYNDANFGGFIETFEISVSNNLEPVYSEITFSNIIHTNEFDDLELANETLIIDVVADEEAVMQYVIDNTTLEVIEGQIVASFPVEIPSYFDEAGYLINSVIEVTEDIEHSITIVRGQVQLVFPNGLLAGEYTYTELVALAMDMDEPQAAEFVAATYNEATEAYSIIISGNSYAFATTVNIKSVISNDEFVNEVVLASLVFDLDVEPDQNAINNVDQNLQNAKDAAYSLNGADYTFPSFVASWYHLDQAMILGEATIEEKITKTEAINNVLNQILITNDLWEDFLEKRSDGQEALTTYADFSGQDNYLSLQDILADAQDMAINALMNALDETLDPMTRDDVSAMINEIQLAIDNLELDQEILELQESIQEGMNYEYTPVYNYLYESIALDGNTMTVEYLQSVLLAYQETAPDGRTFTFNAGMFHDLARFLGGLNRAQLSTVEAIIWNEVEYTWNIESGELKGSNWRDSEGNTLMAAIAAEYPNEDPYTAMTFILVDQYDNQVELTVVFNVVMDVDASMAALELTPENAIGYEYVDYDYLYNQVLDGTIYYTESVLLANNSQDPLNGAMTDLARYLGALYRVEGSVVEKVIYRNVTFVWNEQGTLKGSNWVMEGNAEISLVAAVVNGYGFYPNDAIEFILVDQFGNEFTLSLTFEIEEDVTSINNLEQNIDEAKDYVYDPVYDYTYESIVLENNTVTVNYLQSVLEAYQLTAPEGRTFTFNAAMFHDLARYLGAIERVNGSVETIIWNETEYTWNIESGELKGSNWRDSKGNTLMAAIATMYSTETAYDQMVFTLRDANGYEVDLTVVFNVTFDRYENELNQLETEINNLDENDYTVSSWSEADFASVLAMPEETQAQMAAKITALEEGLEVLVVKVTEENSNFILTLGDEYGNDTGVVIDSKTQVNANTKIFVHINTEADGYISWVTAIYRSTSLVTEGFTMENQTTGFMTLSDDTVRTTIKVYLQNIGEDERVILRIDFNYK